MVVMKICFQKFVLLPRFTGVIMLCLFANISLSQNSVPFFISGNSLKKSTARKLNIEIHSTSFFKNNEYKNDVTQGYTLTGSWIRPELTYNPDKKLSIELGGNVLKYNGRDDYKFSPWFSVHYKPIEKMTLILGNLNSDRNHGLFETQLNSENWLTQKPEAGLQLLTDSRFFRSDLWIDWQQMIMKGDPYQEQFVFGSVMDGKLYHQNSWNITLPLSFHGLHRGGEIDASDLPVNTFITLSSGLKVQKNCSSKFIRSFYAAVNMLISFYPEGSTALPSDRGNAIHLLSGITGLYGNLTAAYWQGNKYYTPLGAPMYQNGENGKPDYMDKNQLVTFNYCLDRKILDGSRFGFVFDLFYDINTQKLSNSAGLYLVINLGFPVIK